MVKLANILKTTCGGNGWEEKNDSDTIRDLEFLVDEKRKKNCED